ncbi:MAG: hypothetical protein ABFR95_05090 [Actinomycetota bacterium]
MSQVFGGIVLLPGETGEGLHASIEIDAEMTRLLAGDDELGLWRRSECAVTPGGSGTFFLALGGEELTFTPSSPSAFAEAMSVPLTPEPPQDVESQEPKYDVDAAIDEVIANIKPLRDPNADDEILSKPMLVGIVGLSTFVMAGLATATLML